MRSNLTIEIWLENAAFCNAQGELTAESAGAQVARFLRGLASDYEAHGVVEGRELRDTNGNRVGYARVVL